MAAVERVEDGVGVAPAADLAAMYLQMSRIRHFEEALADLWQRGLISGEMHLAVGEEAVHAGVCANLVDGDAVAVDHRSTPPFVARGVDLLELLLEILGHEEGLNGGNGGHMHLFAPGRLLASSGIVGASAPLAAGFGLAADLLRPGSVAVAFFGEGAVNQGMVMEALNLAVAWKLPVLFVCKDNGWAITTRSATVTGGDLVDRAAAFGMPATRVDGVRVNRVRAAASRAVSRARRGHGPSFLLCRVPRPYGHFLGDPLLRLVEHPVSESTLVMPALARAAVAEGGASVRGRLSGLSEIARTSVGAGVAKLQSHADPLRIAARRLPAAVVESANEAARNEVEVAVRAALGSLKATHG